MRIVSIFILFYFGVGGVAHGQTQRLIKADPCFKNGWAKEQYIALRNSDFVVADSERQVLAKQLSYCLASSEPMLRDDIAYKAYATWLRAGKLSKDTQLWLFNRFLSDIEERRNDEYQVYLPFVTLALSEVVRVDRITPYLNARQHQRVVQVVSEYMQSLRDYRGFDAKLGWRHGIAHSADVMLQLILNKQTTSSHVDLMLKALANQIKPADAHFYIYGEPERLAMPVVYAMLREDIKFADWQTWFADISAAKPFKDWSQVYKSQSGLAQKHNVKGFLLSLQGMVLPSTHEKLTPFKDLIETALSKLN
ncbi:DUF2785 domain-containing protein [Paraglaciecola aquimarina]|uniref:DUF2785 domain-containing protein n=1 Tax=Paraglaciecola aquimarina TaxID=1235557 RepID=A0ABU3STU9_9ALTE|nr:DUF2785 domain-containing protein [Paraglaciecola aquimarina]MDU0353424.1 DUF2785 domain-containing protein [Paraglaciecola aquimarina]